MPSPLYDDAAQTAVELLTELGQALVISRNVGSGGAYNPEDGSVGDVADVVMNGFGVALDYTIREVGDGSQIRIDDTRIYISPDISDTPRQGDVIALADGRKFSVVTSRPLAPAGRVVLHDVQARTL